MAEPRRRERERGRVGRLALGGVALLSILVGALLYNFAEPLGFDRGTVEIVALAFLIAGLADFVILCFWDSLLRRRS